MQEIGASISHILHQMVEEITNLDKLHEPIDFSDLILVLNSIREVLPRVEMPEQFKNRFKK
jgi:hypothetical protein